MNCGLRVLNSARETMPLIVVTPGIQKTDLKRNIGLIPFIMIRKHVKGVSEIMAFKVAVPTPGRIR